MFRRPSTVLVAALAAFGVAAMAPEAKALCIPSNSVCSTFDPATQSDPAGVGGFTGTGTSAGANYSVARLIVDTTGFTGSTFNLTNFSLTGNGIASSLTGFGSVAITGNGTALSNYSTLTTSLNSVDFTQSTLSFTIPSGVGFGTSFTVSIQYADSSTVPLQVATSANDFTTTTITPPPPAAAPGPLPLIGAGAAFAYSRKLRNRLIRHNNI